MLPGRIAGKLEFYDPGSSVKDRIGVSMIEAAEREGLINEDTMLFARSPQRPVELALL